MLNLGAIETLYYDVKMPEPDGRVLHIQTPTQKFYEYMIAFDEKVKDLSDTQYDKQIREYATRIINRNEEGIVYTVNQIKQLVPTSVCGILCQGYKKWIVDILNNMVNDPNLKSLTTKKA